MKRIFISLSICVAFFFNTKAQSNLQFNKVYFLELTAQGDTVPQGKVWKVESAVITPYIYGNTLSYPCQFYVNNVIVKLQESLRISSANSFNSSYNLGRVFPMWLPEGTIVKSYTRVEALSVIEFNLE